MRSIQQNRLYHELAHQLHNLTEIKVWDGEFEIFGYPNPFVIRPKNINYDSFRDLMKQLDKYYPKNKDGLALSSTKTSVEDMNKHISFFEILIQENQKKE